MKSTPPPANSNEAGYTLTELLVVLVILGLIAAAIAPRIIGRLDSSKVRAAKVQLSTLSAAVDVYYIDTGQYPPQQEGLESLMSQPQGVESWDGPYIRTRSNLIDPWGNAFVYNPSKDGSQPTLITLGSDGTAGGEGRATDLVFPEE